MSRGSTRVAYVERGSSETNNNYSELLASLPHVVDPFRYQGHAISIVQLRKRMNMLLPDDYERMSRIQRLFYWGGMQLETDESILISQARRLVEQLPYEDLRTWLDWRMDIRSVLAAWRRRKAGHSPTSSSFSAYGPCRHQIAKHWSSPRFKLEHRYPVLPELLRHFEAGESYELEKALLLTIWRYYDTRKPDRPCGFSAVMLYLMKWDLVDRWCSYERKHALKRFDALSDAAMPNDDFLNIEGSQP